MNIKGLLISSAAAVVAVSGAQAADAIVIAEPEPMEYVRICDTYGTGFFYIPGTETCLKIGGYLRYQMEYVDNNSGSSFGKYARFAPHFIAKNATEWGTLTSYAEVEFNWASTSTSASVLGNHVGTRLIHGYISLENGTNSFLVGKTDTPFYDFLGYWAGSTIHEGAYPGGNNGQVRYTYTGGNGFKFVLAAVENANTSDFNPSVEAGASLDQDWGWVAGAVAYDTDVDQFSARAGLGFKLTPSISASLHAMYSDDSVNGMYNLLEAPWTGSTRAEWAVLANLSAGLTEKVTLNGHFQYFDTEEWNAAVNVAWAPVNGLTITPEIAYESATDSTIGFLRFQRNF